MDYETMTDDELVAENQRLGADIDAIRERRYEIKAVLDQRDRDRKATKLLEGLTDEERAALVAAAKRS